MAVKEAVVAAIRFATFLRGMPHLVFGTQIDAALAIPALASRAARNAFGAFRDPPEAVFATLDAMVVLPELTIRARRNAFSFIGQPGCARRTGRWQVELNSTNLLVLLSATRAGERRGLWYQLFFELHPA